MSIPFFACELYSHIPSLYAQSYSILKGCTYTNYSHSNPRYYRGSPIILQLYIRLTIIFVHILLLMASAFSFGFSEKELRVCFAFC